MKKIIIFLSFPTLFFISLILSIVFIQKIKLPFLFIAISALIIYTVFAVKFLIDKKIAAVLLTFLAFLINLSALYRTDNINKNYFQALKEIKNSKEILGYISDFTLNKNKRTDFTFTVYGIKDYEISDFKKIKPFKVIVKIKGDYEKNFRRGDVIAISDKITIPQEKINDFKYRDFLYYKKIYGLVNTKNERLRLIERKIGISEYEFFLKRTLWDFREKCLNKLKKNFNEKSYSFILSIFFGIRSELDNEIYLDFQNTGMLHLLAISGMHIGFIAGVFFMFFNLFLSKSKAYVISSIFLFGYVAIILASPSSGRAFIMYLINSAFFIFGLKTIGMTILSLSGIFLIFINPFCIFDLGFQLSFFATAGILLFSKMFESAIPFPIPSKIKSVFCVTLSAFSSLFFIQWALFKKIQFFALISSIFVIPFFEYLFTFLFFGIIVFYLTNFNLLRITMEFIIDIFLKTISFLNNIPPLHLPEIPPFLAYLSFPLTIIVCYVLAPKILPFIKKTIIYLRALYFLFFKQKVSN
ncbi:MAG TPA: ComEC/Rec2 family competence protein [Spirochaetota bacterium]|nr:ComEC/Rec2 family competence protein [Spirochaetota bacterium]